MWKDLSERWQIVLKEAWTAFCSGSIPIGAAVFDKQGRLLIKDHNRGGEPETPTPRAAHAEMNALRLLDCRLGINVKELTLLSSMEPCPMCLGAVVMCNIKKVEYGAHDRWCGAIHQLDSDPYYRSQRISVTDPGEETEFFQLVLSSYYELNQIKKGSSPSVLECFRISSGSAVGFAEKLYLRKVLDHFVIDKRPCAEVYDYIMQLKESKDV